jgi:hypothetical protein
MAYARLSTRITAGLHPNLRGLRGIAPNPTTSSAGLRPEFRGLGQNEPSASLVISPGGFSVSTAPAAGPSLCDQVTGWLGGYSLGVPNTVWAIGAGLFVLSRFGRHR